MHLQKGIYNFIVSGSPTPLFLNIPASLSDMKDRSAPVSISPLVSSLSLVGFCWIGVEIGLGKVRSRKGMNGNIKIVEHPFPILLI